MFKIRLLLASGLFAAFFYCHYTDTKFMDYPTEQVLVFISDNHYYTNLKNYVMIQERTSVSEKREDFFE